VSVVGTDGRSVAQEGYAIAEAGMNDSSALFLKISLIKIG
jgi:hypothetical protein